MRSEEPQGLAPLCSPLCLLSCPRPPRPELGGLSPRPAPQRPPRLVSRWQCGLQSRSLGRGLLDRWPQTPEAGGGEKGGGRFWGPCNVAATLCEERQLYPSRWAGGA